MNPHFNSFKKEITHPLRFRLFILTQLPSAFFAGLRVHALTPQQAVVSVRYKWFNKNPFRSIYVAVLSMPSEVSTGILCMGALYKRNPPVSMLVVKSDGQYYKKATGTILFTCNDGDAINEAVEQAIATGEATEVNCYTAGTNEAGQVVADFHFTWSFKVKSKK